MSLDDLIDISCQSRVMSCHFSYFRSYLVNLSIYAALRWWLFLKTRLSWLTKGHVACLCCCSRYVLDRSKVGFGYSCVLASRAQPQPHTHVHSHMLPHQHSHTATAARIEPSSDQHSYSYAHRMHLTKQHIIKIKNIKETHKETFRLLDSCPRLFYA